MLETLADLRAGLSGLKGVGKITKDDYTTIFEPMLDEARRGGMSSPLS